MRIESLSIKSATITIFAMIGIVAIVLSLLAGTYFRQSALDAQLSSLSRIVEVATQEVQKNIADLTFEISMKLANSRRLVEAYTIVLEYGNKSELTNQLDDPFKTGFVGFSEINLVKLRVYNLDMGFVGQSSLGLEDLKESLPDFLFREISNRKQGDRLKGVEALWMSSRGPLFSIVVPLGGLRSVGYLEVVIDPVFNLSDISRVTGTPVSIYSLNDDVLTSVNHTAIDEYLPIEYVLTTSSGVPAFRIVGHEDVGRLNTDMMQTKFVTITGFLLLLFATLLIALQLFNRFMLLPVREMIATMKQMAQGKFNLSVDSRALQEFHVLADSFNVMANMVQMRTNDLKRLLDLDDSGLVCFDGDGEVVYFNKSVSALLDYPDDELSDLDMQDLFNDSIPQLLEKSDGVDDDEKKHHVSLRCRTRDGNEQTFEAVINRIEVLGQQGYAVALSTVTDVSHQQSDLSERRLDAVEGSLASLLSLTRESSSLFGGSLSSENDPSGMAATDKVVIREEGVKIMNLALACWERDLGKTKINLAEDSGIWPVYIDKSTPTTRTLDKYLNLDLCPKNPRYKRVIKTVEFVLGHIDHQDTSSCENLQVSLESFRNLIAGIR